MVTKFRTCFNFTYGSRREFISALYPFILLGCISPLMSLLTQSGWLVPQSRLVNGIFIFLIVVLGILFLLGLVTGLPRWFLPYVGFVFSLVSVYGFSRLLEQWDVIPFQALYSRSWFLGQVAYQGFLWSGLTMVAILLVALVILIPPLWRFKSDWTLLIFLLYGAVPFGLLLTFDDYANGRELSILVVFLIFVAGVWFYLHSDNTRHQLWFLFGAMTVSLFLAAVAKAIVYQYFWGGIRHFTWWTEMMSTVLMWGWIALSMLIPLALNLFPRSDNSPQAAGSIRQ